MVAVILFEAAHESSEQVNIDSECVLFDSSYLVHVRKTLVEAAFI